MFWLRNKKNDIQLLTLGALVSQSLSYLDFCECMTKGNLGQIKNKCVLDNRSEDVMLGSNPFLKKKIMDFFFFYAF